MIPKPTTPAGQVGAAAMHQPPEDIGERTGADGPGAVNNYSTKPLLTDPSPDPPPDIALQAHRRPVEGRWLCLGTQSHPDGQTDWIRLPRGPEQGVPHECCTTNAR